MKYLRSLVIVMALMLLGACTRVDTTEWCVLTRYGNVIEQRMTEGLKWTPIADAECFPLVDLNYPENPESAERVPAQTSDPVTVQGDVSIVWAYDPSDLYTNAFLEKRSHRAAEAEVVNAIREGYRTALAGWSVDDIFSGRRTELADSVRAHIQRKLGKRALIKTVFVRDISLPGVIEDARVTAAKQEQVLDAARKQYQIDSVETAAQIVKAKGQVELQRVQSEVYRTNPEMMKIEIEKARAEAFAKVCSGAQTCILGGSVMDTWKGGVVR